MNSHNVFISPSRSRAGDAWFLAGLQSSFPNITTSGDTTLTARLPLPCGNDFARRAPACKAFQVPPTDSSKATEVDIDDCVEGLKDQVLVFQYRGVFHAVDHSCPHSSYPLSRGTPFDIEDFGVRLSAGLQCPKHDWSFDLFRGNGDRGKYKLKIWEVQLRPTPKRGEKQNSAENVSTSDGEGDAEEMEVWVRRKQRIG